MYLTKYTPRALDLFLSFFLSKSKHVFGNATVDDECYRNEYCTIGKVGSEQTTSVEVNLGIKGKVSIKFQG